MKVLGIIPARYKSSRYPGKPLVNLLGKPLVLHVAEKAAMALGSENIVVATEDERIMRTVVEAGFKGVMTSDKHLTGTDRLWEVAQNIKADIYINIQGDEPMVHPEDILKIYREKEAFPDHVVNGMCALSAEEDPCNINIPKVLVNSRNNLIYMSRLPIPGIKTDIGRKPVYLKQVCIYAFTYKQLQAYGTMNKKAEFEAYEDIEILRFLELGIPIQMTFTNGNTLAVDVPEDVAKVSEAMKKLIA